MDGFQKELLERQAKNDFPEELRKYALTVWNELTELYAEGIWDSKIELTQQATEEAVKAL